MHVPLASRPTSTCLASLAFYKSNGGRVSQASDGKRLCSGQLEVYFNARHPYLLLNLKNSAG